MDTPETFFTNEEDPIFFKAYRIIKSLERLNFQEESSKRNLEMITEILRIGHSTIRKDQRDLVFVLASRTFKINLIQYDGLIYRVDHQDFYSLAVINEGERLEISQRNERVFDLSDIENIMLNRLTELGYTGWRTRFFPDTATRQKRDYGFQETFLN